MTQIAATDAALIQLLQSCDLPGPVVVESTPHEWSPGYVQRLLTATPAVLVAFLGAEPYDNDISPLLDLAGKWSCVVCVGWNGASQKERRLATGGGYDLMHRAAAVLHKAKLTEPNGASLTDVRVDSLQVLTDSATDISNLWIGEISLTIELPMELLPGPCLGPLTDFLRIRGPLVVADPAADIPLDTDLPQS